MKFWKTLSFLLTLVAFAGGVTLFTGCGVTPAVPEVDLSKTYYTTVCPAEDAFLLHEGSGEYLGIHQGAITQMYEGHSLQEIFDYALETGYPNAQKVIDGWDNDACPPSDGGSLQHPAFGSIDTPKGFFDDTDNWITGEEYEKVLQLRHGV
jgi:hypothetical protein